MSASTGRFRDAPSVVACPTRHSRSGVVGSVLALLLITGPVEGVAAQDQSLWRFSWSTEAKVLGANALLGGLSAGFSSLLRGETPVPAFLRGAGGGAMIYAGKKIVVQPEPGMGLLGRQVASVGGSIIGNELVGRGAFDRIALSFGPMRAYVGSEVEGVDWRLDVPAIGSAVWGVMKGGEVRLGSTLSYGSLVLARPYGGSALPGTIFYGDYGGSDFQDYVVAHEQVHVLQYDQSFLAWGDPFEAWLGREVSFLEGLFEHLEFNVPALGTAVFLGHVVWERHSDMIWEQEAIYLGRTR